MEIVEGEEISQDEASSPAWMTAYGRKNNKGMRMANITRERTPTRGGRKGGGGTAAPRNAYQRIVATSRLPQLPRDTYRIIVRSRDGLNMTKAQQVRLGDCTYRVSVYPAPPDDTSKGAIKGVDVDISEAQLRARIVNHRNSGAIEVKRIKNTTAVVVLFKGMKVPNYVSCGASMFRCTLYRRHTEVCYGCGGLGHRADVCPNPNSKWCRTTPKKGRSITPAAQRRKSRSRSRGRSASRRRIQEELTWADRVKEKTPKPKKVTRSASPEHNEKGDIEQLRQEIASLKAKLRKQTASQAISSRVEGANLADNAVHKSTQEPKVEINKAKRKAPPPKDESGSEMQVESSQKKMLDELLRISKENQLSINQLALRIRALESKVGAIEYKVVALENKMAIKTRPKVRTQAAVNDDAGATPQSQ
ncbi:hypothetical protein HPB51_017431 [Rhipicephalus microplus]|uniref:CCHC-type domain-containing protein n=1 Tax=Rhipicephalus microplus TaxID=6941 RepID=A0A9J6E2L3_RHIMP|nr:hypothetical protein HPB51_017431 [Rhipicephalus microplus]